MAPVPQRRSRAETEDSQIVSVETATSALRQQPAKRRRLSTLTPGLDSESEFGRENREVTVYEDEPFEPQDYDTRRDARLDEETQYQEKDDFRSTQLVRQHFDEAKENKPAENGIIEQVVCHNFMCHKKLVVNFGPLINFIIGHNGSGKSAVLTALTICLGGKATSTNRGQNLKAFIKEGEDSCMLSVKLKNHGDTGYRPELYGNSIFIERHFSRNGTSGFKVKNDSGRVISTKRYDLDEISDHFALQLDNPMNVLTQDMARQFLNNSTAADKYRFFVKGTQLEQLDNDYHMIEQYADAIEGRISTRQESISILEQRFKQADNKRRIAEKNETLNDKIRELRRQFAWAQVEEQERTLDDMRGRIGDADEKIEQRTSEAESYAQALESAEQNLERAQNTITNLKNDLQPHEEHHAELSELFTANKNKLINQQTQQRNINSHLRTTKLAIDKAEQSIQEEKRRLEDQNGGEHARKLDEIQKAKERAAVLKIEFEAHCAELAGLDRSKGDAEREASEARPAVAQKAQALENAKSILQNLNNNQGHQNGAYHPNTSNLLRAIQAETRFRERPVGPLGQHIRLKPSKTEWSSIIERTLGGNLSAFVVTSKADQGVLDEISKRVRCPCSVFIGDGQPLDISRSQPDPQYDTILRVLEINSDLVRNQLIINNAIEQTVLIKDQTDAYNFMNNNPEGRPRNTKACLAFHPTQRGHGLRYTASATSSKMDPVPAWTQGSRLQTDTEAQKRNQVALVQHLQSELQQVQSKSQALEDALTTAINNISQHEQRKKQLKIQQQRAEDDADRLRDELDEETPQDGKLDELQSQLENSRAESQQFSTDYENAIIEKDKLNEDQRALMRQRDEAEAIINESKTKIDKATTKMQKLSDHRTAALHEKNSAFERIRDAQDEKQQLEHDCADQEAKVVNFDEQASKISARVPVPPGVSPDDLDRRLMKLMKDLDSYRAQQGGSLEDLTNATTAAKKAWRTAQRELDGFLTTADQLKRSMFQRRNRWMDFRRFISSRARANFTYLLSERAFRGNLKLDHKSKLLDLSVEPDITRASDRGRQTKTLSGGEKSFSTICLLLSIWEAMGSPIRCLDEFDVFMDNVNRDVSMKMMINAARRSVGRQFVLITPQAMGNVDSAEDVRIHKMRDPERGQTTISFGN
ncbi:MAG: hypothetical protein Q9165_001429 [Trypethelium subeluteriae]